MTPSRFAQGSHHVSYEHRVDFTSLRAKRIAKADEQRRKAGLDALLVWKDENGRYLTDLRYRDRRPARIRCHWRGQ